MSHHPHKGSCSSEDGRSRDQPLALLALRLMVVLDLAVLVLWLECEGQCVTVGNNRVEKREVCGIVSC